MPTPVVYRAVNTLREGGLIVDAGEERSDSGPPRTLLQITTSGYDNLTAWLAAPVTHLRDVRSEFMLKLALLDRLRVSTRPLVSAQLAVFEPLVGGLERQANTSDAGSFDTTLLRWRLESARGVNRFLEELLAHSNDASTARAAAELVSPLRR